MMLRVMGDGLCCSFGAGSWYNTVVLQLVAHTTGGTIQLVEHGFGRTLILAGIKMVLAGSKKSSMYIRYIVRTYRT